MLDGLLILGPQCSLALSNANVDPYELDLIHHCLIDVRAATNILWPS
jgi:hypothetical protein